MNREREAVLPENILRQTLESLLHRNDEQLPPALPAPLETIDLPRPVTRPAKSNEKTCRLIL